MTLGVGGPEMLPREWSDKRQCSPQFLVSRSRGLEEMHPNFLWEKEDGRELYFQNLQDSVNVALQYTRISSSDCVSFLVCLVRLNSLPSPVICCNSNSIDIFFYWYFPSQCCTVTFVVVKLFAKLACFITFKDLLLAHDTVQPFLDQVFKYR